MRRIVLGVVTVAALALSASCAHKVEPPPTVTEIPAQSFARQWSLDLGDHKKLEIEQVYTVGPYLSILTKDRISYIIDRASGKLVTAHEIEEPGTVLRPFTNGKLIGYPVSTGLELFDLQGKHVKTVNLKSGVRSSAAFSDSAIYVGVDALNGGRLLAIDPTRQFDTPKWEVLAFGGIPSTPIYMDQTVFFATNTGRVYAVNEAREPVWPLDHNYFQCGPVESDIAADDFGLYVASTDTKLVCLNRANGRVKWQYFAGEPLYTTPIPTSDTVYIPVRSQGLVAINKADGEFNRKPKWISREATQLLSEDNQYTYVRLRGNSIAAVDKATGAVQFRSGRGNFDFFVTNPDKDGLIFAATKDGYIAAIRPVTKPGTIGELMFTAPAK